MTTKTRTTAEPVDDAFVRSHVDRAEQWLFNSGIYVVDREDPDHGAVFSEYDSKRARYDFLYAEATGYILSLWKYLVINRTHTLTDDARASGEWLVRWAGQHDGVIAMGKRDGRTLSRAYAFDNGICCKGLLDLHELTGEAKYLRCAERIADWLVTHAVNSDGSVRPIFHVDAGAFAENPALWFGASGSFHAKIAMALLQLSSVSKKRQTREIALRMYEWALRQQRPDGSFPANKHANYTFFHAHCYTTEALLYAYACERDLRFLTGATRAIEWIVRMQNPAGYFPRWHGNGWFKGKASDAQAQGVRLMCLFNMLQPRPRIATALDKAVIALVGLQSAGEDARKRGGFFEGDVRRYRVFPRKSARMTSWAAMFAIQALRLAAKRDGDFFSVGKFLF